VSDMDTSIRRRVRLCTEKIIHTSTHTSLEAGACAEEASRPDSITTTATASSATAPSTPTSVPWLRFEGRTIEACLFVRLRLRPNRKIDDFMLHRNIDREDVHPKTLFEIWLNA